MYLRESKQRRADCSTVSCLQLAENEWVPERRRAETRVVCDCGRADDPAGTERLRKPPAAQAAEIVRAVAARDFAALGLN